MSPPRYSVSLIVPAAFADLRHPTDLASISEDEINRKCLEALQCPDSRKVKNRLKNTKDELLRDSYKWILSHEQYYRWRDSDDLSLLWIKGGAGKGKTMMAIGLTEELSQGAERKASVVYFFCQNADQELNTIQAVIKGLIARLIAHDHTLIKVLRRRWSVQENDFAEDLSHWQALWEVFLEMVDECQHTGAKIFVIVDALDECREKALASFLRTVVRTGLDRPDRLKWLLTSRPLGSIEHDLIQGAKRIHVSFELNAERVNDGIRTFIESQVDKLALRHDYDAPTKYAVKEAIRVRANGTFLWASLVCKQLENVHTHKAMAKVNETPPELERLYNQAYTKLGSALESNVEHQDQHHLLSTLMLAFRPLSLPEAIVLNILTEDPRERKALIDRCSTFVTLRDEDGVQYFDFVHQSARDYLSERSKTPHDTGISIDHNQMFKLCFISLSRHLRTDVVRGATASATREDLLERHRQLNAGLDYAARFWIDHLRAATETNPTSGTTIEYGDIEVFLQSYFLPWIEHLSLSDQLSSAITGITTLQTLLAKHWVRSSHLNFQSSPYSFHLPAYSTSLA